MKTKKLWAILMALGLVAAACGSDSEETSESADATASSDGGSDDGGSDDGGSDDGGGEAAPAALITDIGVTDTEIRIGYNADLSGIFAANITPIIEATEVYWEFVNDNGGIAGREVVPVILDSGYDVPRHLENHEVLSGDGAESVVMIGQSTGSPQTAATAEDLIEDDMVAVPLSWYSGWADESIGANVLEVQGNYCLEAANGVTYMSETYGNKMALITMPGDYGQDAAVGAKLAAEELGLEIVYDGEAAVIPVPGTDQTPVINEIVNSGADFVWSAGTAGTLAEIMGGADAQGFDGYWGTSTPGYNPGLLDSDLGPLVDERLTFSGFNESWDPNGSEGMQELIAEMRARRPEAIMSDFFITGWLNGIIVQQVLEQAAANGDMTRAGVTAAAKEITVDMKGLAPDQTWSGEPNDNIVRETYLFDVDASVYTPGALVSQEDASVGLTLIRGPYASQTALDFNYEGPCYVAE